MTVKEICAALDPKVNVSLVWDMTLTKIDHSDPVIIDAFGSYKVDKITPTNNAVELRIMLRPVKEV